MKKCECKNWKDNEGILNSAIIFYSCHGFGGLKKSFNYCPYCGKKLKKVKEK